MMKVAVVDEVSAGDESLAVAPGEADTAVAVVPDVAALHPVIGAAVDPHAIVAGEMRQPATLMAWPRVAVSSRSCKTTWRAPLRATSGLSSSDSITSALFRGLGGHR